MSLVQNLSHQTIMYLESGTVRGLHGKLIGYYEPGKLQNARGRGIALIRGNEILDLAGKTMLGRIERDQILNHRNQVIGYVADGTEEEKAAAGAAYLLFGIFN